MSRTAITRAKYLLTLRTSRRGPPFLDWLIRRPSSARARGAPSDEGVDTDGDEKDHAQKLVVPVGVPVGEDDADLGKTDDQRAQRGPDCGTVSTGQEAPSDHGGDDVEELEPNSLARLDPLEAKGDHDADHGRRNRRVHEEDHLRSRDRNADGARGVGVSADSEDPVSESGLGQHHRGDYGDGDPPEHRILEVVGGEERAADRDDSVGRGGVGPVLHARNRGEQVSWRGVDACEKQVNREGADQGPQLGALQKAHQNADAGQPLVSPRARLLGGRTRTGLGACHAHLLRSPDVTGPESTGPVISSDSVYLVPLPARLATVAALLLSTMPGPLLTVSKPPTVFAFCLNSLRKTIGR